MIKPTVGRVVHYYSSAEDRAGGMVGQGPLTAHVCCVHDVRCVNLAVFDEHGEHSSRTSVTLVQPDEERPDGGRYCEWMPYQVKKATGSESGEPAAGTEVV